MAGVRPNPLMMQNQQQKLPARSKAGFFRKVGTFGGSALFALGMAFAHGASQLSPSIIQYFKYKDDLPPGELILRDNSHEVLLATYLTYAIIGFGVFACLSCFIFVLMKLRNRRSSKRSKRKKQKTNPNSSNDGDDDDDDDDKCNDTNATQKVKEP